MEVDRKQDAWVELPDPQLFELIGANSGHPYNFGFVPAMGRLIGAHPGIAPAFGAIFHAVMFAPGVLSRSEREMVAAVAAGAQDCHY